MCTLCFGFPLTTEREDSAMNGQVGLSGRKMAAGALVSVACILLIASALLVPSEAQQTLTYAVIPPNKDDDIRLYLAGRQMAKGRDALGRMRDEADLLLWLAGNQFFAMDDVIAAFQNARPGLKVGLITLPPGLLLEAIEKGGWRYGDATYPGRPDIYASVNLGHLKRLKALGLMDAYSIYMHNELQIMVARGNPKRIRGIDDLGRQDVRTSMPNPVNEGIMQFYGRKVLEGHGLWPIISADKECISCQTTGRNWFTAVHHRETPERIRTDQSDAGIVWRTEVLQALRDGAPIEGVELVPEDSLRQDVSYVVGALTASPHRANAEAYLAFLRSGPGQEAYEKFGFVKASPDELSPQPIR
jgi:ABC-type molybdate transport system substrate-binding protein